MAVNPITNRIYVSNSWDDTVSVLGNGPAAVGGIAEHPQLQPEAASSAHGPSEPEFLAIGGAIAGGALLLMAGWHAKRRWLA